MCSHRVIINNKIRSFNVQARQLQYNEQRIVP